MNKKERISAAIHFEKADQLPYAFWSHLPGIDLDPAALAEHTYEFYKKYDLDLVKTMNNGMYPVEDFGCVADYSEIEKGGIGKIVSTPIHHAEDLFELRPCSVSKGSLARELYSLQLLLDKLKAEEVPVVFTVFSPITTLDKLCQKKALDYIREGHGEAAKHALRVITETTAAVVREALRLGADGVFFASQMSTYNVMTAGEYLEYGVPYDQQVLQAAASGWINVLHAHGTNIMFDILKDYPVHAFNWHAWESLPSIDQAKAMTGKCLMCGLERKDITDSNRSPILNQIFQTCQITRGRGLILTPGCVIRYPLNDDMLAYIRSAKEMVERALFLVD